MQRLRLFFTRFSSQPLQCCPLATKASAPSPRTQLREMAQGETQEDMIRLNELRVQTSAQFVQTSHGRISRGFPPRPSSGFRAEQP